MDMEAFPSAAEQWTTITTLFTAKSIYNQADLHQAFLDMRCLRGGDIQEYLTSLRMKHHELKVANIGVTDIEYEWTILKGLPDILAAHTAQTLSMLRLAVKYTSKPIDMSDVINSVCKEADCIKTCCMLKDQSLGQGKGKKGAQTDEALATTTFKQGNNSNFTNRCKKGKCNHCGKEGHWIQECHTKKQEEATVQSGQAAQASLSSKPKNKPMGSTNTVTVNEDDSDDRGFWAVKEEEVYMCFVELDSLLDDLDSDDEDKDFHAELGVSNDHLDWPDIEGEDWYFKDTAMAVITPAEAITTPRAKLYNSGTS